MVRANGGKARATLALGLLPMALLATACGGGGGGGSEEGPGADLLVLQQTPTNSQEVLDNLQDPGLNGKVTLVFTDTPREATMIDRSNAFNGLTPDVQFLDQNFNRVAGTPSIDATTRTFSFTPAGNTLTPAQYTLTVSRFVATASGARINLGLKDFSTSFTVGDDIYPPVIRNTTPAANQNEVNLHQKIVVTFNESLDPASVVLGQTVFVQDGGTNPPTQLAGTLALDRDNFDLVFTPDPCTGMPPATTIVVRMLGAGNVSFVRDLVGNAMQGDVGNPAGERTFQFNTISGNPLPSPRYVPTGAQFLSLPWQQTRAWTFYASTSNRVLAFDTAPAHSLVTGLPTDLSLVQQILATNVARVDWTTPPGPTIGFFPYGGDWITKIESTGEAVLDTRFEATLGHTYIYMCDASNNRVVAINTGTGRIEGAFNGIGSPRGISFLNASPILFVSNYGEGSVTALDLSQIVPGTSICAAVSSINEDPNRRGRAMVGRSPTGVAANFEGFTLVTVCNSADNTISILDTRSLVGTVALPFQETYQVGANPTEVVWAGATLQYGLIMWIACQGDADNPNGSVHMWWSTAGGYAFGTLTGSVPGAVQDGINNPAGVFCLGTNGNLTAFIPNSGDDTIATVNPVTRGGLFFTTAIPELATVRSMPGNPVKVTFVPFSISTPAVALAGTGQIAMYSTSNLFSPPTLLSAPGVRAVFSCWDQ